jgi:hypothetical protein
VVALALTARPHDAEPEQRSRTGNEGRTNNRPLIASGHEGTGYHPDALEEEQDSGGKREHGDDTKDESHG